MKCENRAKVTITGGPPGFLIEDYDEKTTVTYDIDVEWRSWGIKTITITPLGQTTIQLTYTSEDDENESYAEEVTVDLEQLQTEVIAGEGSIFVESIELTLTPDRQVDYKNSTCIIFMGH